MSEEHNNNGGNNSFYDIPDWVKNVDDLNEFIQATGPMSNVMKSLFGMNKARHTGTSPDRDSKKILHYGVRILLWLARPKNENIQDVDILIQLFKELPEHKKVKFVNSINQDGDKKSPYPESTIMKTIETVVMNSDVEDVKQPDLSIYESYLEINNNRVFTHTESDIDYLIHAVMGDGDTIVVIQEGVVRGTTDSFTEEDFINQFKLKG